MWPIRTIVMELDSRMTHGSTKTFQKANKHYATKLHICDNQGVMLFDKEAKGTNVWGQAHWTGDSVEYNNDTPLTLMSRRERY